MRRVTGVAKQSFAFWHSREVPDEVRSMYLESSRKGGDGATNYELRIPNYEGKPYERKVAVPTNKEERVSDVCETVE